MTSNIYSIHHTSFIISEIEKSRHFYCEILDLELDTSRPNLSFEGLWLNLNESQQIHLLCIDNPDSLKRPEHGGRDRHTAFRVKDLSKIRMRLDDFNIPYTMSTSGREALFLRDPDGNTLELIKHTPEN